MFKFALYFSEEATQSRGGAKRKEMFAALCIIAMQAHSWDDKLHNAQKNTAKLRSLSAYSSIKGLWSAFICGGQSATTQSIRNAGSHLPKNPFCWSSRRGSGNFCHWNSTMWMQMKSPTGNGEREHMGNREAADEGKKVLSHCCFSWSSDSRIVPGKFGCCFCYLYSEQTGTECIVYSG